MPNNLNWNTNWKIKLKSRQLSTTKSFLKITPKLDQKLYWIAKLLLAYNARATFVLASWIRFYETYFSCTHADFDFQWELPGAGFGRMPGEDLPPCSPASGNARLPGPGVGCSTTTPQALLPETGSANCLQTGKKYNSHWRQLLPQICTVRKGTNFELAILFLLSVKRRVVLIIGICVKWYVPCQVQLLVSQNDVENYTQIRMDLDKLRLMVEKSELWVYVG